MGLTPKMEIRHNLREKEIHQCTKGPLDLSNWALNIMLKDKRNKRYIMISMY